MTDDALAEAIKHHMEQVQTAGLEPSADELTLMHAAFTKQANVYRQRAEEHRSRGAYYCAELADDIAEKAETMADAVTKRRA